ncbi:hypothetical protein GCM10010413_26060 [Promicromonospora sukumoe]
MSAASAARTFSALCALWVAGAAPAALAPVSAVPTISTAADSAITERDVLRDRDMVMCSSSGLGNLVCHGAY